MEPFQNEPILDFSNSKIEGEISRALDALLSQTEERPIVLAGQRLTTGRWLESRDPGNPDRLLGRVACAGPAEVEKAIAAGDEAFPSWSQTPPARRAEILQKTAAIFRKKRFELDALIMLETGKVRIEADADLAEAVDFLEFYAREILRYAEDQPLVKIPGEDNRLHYIPLGTGAVIAPWNFPLAILTGMASAAIVGGNSVVLKPSNESPLIAYRLVEAMEEAGLPPGVLNFLPGKGSEIGDPLVEHPRTRFICFTGSKEVGLRITELAGRLAPGGLWIKRVVTEMGGKDAMIIDDDVDLESTVKGTIAAAFGYQGQKCSACSRLIVLDGVYDEMVQRVAEEARALRVGQVDSPETQVGPVISRTAMDSISRYIEIGKKDGRLVAGGGPADVSGAPDGYYLQPTVFADVAPRARIAQEEIFGPVLSVIRARDFDEAIAIANGTEFGLTGAVYSNNRSHLEQARREFHVGNLYLNRKCTGALVGVHPFGGFNMSGTNSKAGGRDYLLLFQQAKLVAEQVTRG